MFAFVAGIFDDREEIPDSKDSFEGIKVQCCHKNNNE